MRTRSRAAITGLALALACNSPATGEPVGFAQPGTDDCRVRASVSKDTNDAGSGSLASSARGRCDIEAFAFYFAPSDASVGARGEATADALAACLNRPSVAVLRVVLVGHADTRGTAAETPSIAARRAHAVKSLLTRAGVDAQRIETRTELEPADECGAPELRDRRDTLRLSAGS